jgi:hypothetical protein
MAFGQPSVNPKIIEALETALVRAREGNIESLGLVGVTPLSQYVRVVIGSAESVNAGLDVLKTDIVELIRQQRGMGAAMPIGG